MSDFGITRTSPSEMWEDFTSGRAFQEGGQISRDIGIGAMEASPMIGIGFGPLAGGMAAAWGVGMSGLGSMVESFGNLLAGESPLDESAIDNFQAQYGQLSKVGEMVESSLNQHYGTPTYLPTDPDGNANMGLSVPAAMPRTSSKPLPPVSEEMKQILEFASEKNKDGSYEEPLRPGSDEYKKREMERRKKEAAEKRRETLRKKKEAKEAGIKEPKELKAEDAVDDPTLIELLPIKEKLRLAKLLKDKGKNPFSPNNALQPQ